MIYRDGDLLPISAYVIHERKIFERSVYFRLGFRHITDLLNGKLRRSGVSSVDAGGPIYNYQYITPRSLDLNATVRF